MNRKFTLGLIILFLIFALSSCQLAKEELAIASTDQLIGVYVTTEYIDLFDSERYFKDNMDKLLNNKDTQWVENSTKYSGRIYAELKPTEITNVDTNEASNFYEYVFEGIKGEAFFFAQTTQDDGETYVGSLSGSAISNTKVHVGDSTSIEGTLFISTSGPNTMYANPVYQSSDGRVYLVTGMGLSFSGNRTEGATYSQSLFENHAVTENGVTTEKEFKVIIHYEIRHPREHIVINYMNAHNESITHTAYSLDSLPEQIDIPKDTAYILQESSYTTTVGDKVTREIIETGTEYIVSYIPNIDGIFEIKLTNLLWK